MRSAAIVTGLSDSHESRVVGLPGRITRVTSTIAQINGDERPFAWHYFDQLADALDAVKAADLLDIPFLLHKEERPVDDDSVEIQYVVVLLPPGTVLELDSDLEVD
jgi:hypothetical protein